MSEFGDGPLPKGMTLPEAEVVPEAPVARLTVADVNYAGMIRVALDAIPDLALKVTTLSVDEQLGANPVVRLEIEVMPRD